MCSRIPCREACILGAGGKPSTWLPPGGLVEPCCCARNFDFSARWGDLLGGNLHTIRMFRRYANTRRERRPPRSCILSWLQNHRKGIRPTALPRTQASPTNPNAHPNQPGLTQPRATSESKTHLMLWGPPAGATIRCLEATPLDYLPSNIFS